MLTLYELTESEATLTEGIHLFLHKERDGLLTVFATSRIPWDGPGTATEGPGCPREAGQSTGFWARRSTGSKILLSRDSWYHQVEHLGSDSTIYRYIIFLRRAIMSTATGDITQLPIQSATTEQDRSLGLIPRHEPSTSRPISTAGSSQHPTATHAQQFLVSCYQPSPFPQTCPTAFSPQGECR